MEYHPAVAQLAEAAARHQGPGALLRIVLVVMVLGCALTGWFLMRGYKRNDD